ncbi:MAG: hypothetical protein MK226_10125 [Saprospiraceae bacterium]|nr:hypothetical protein [Saprospiraceae bacterium]
MEVVVKQIFFLLILCLGASACESEYSQIVKEEIKSGVIHEDLILGLKMGQTRKEFYDHCWQLNKQKLVAQGPGNKYAKYILTLDSTSQNSEKVEMLFYGIFDEDKIMHGMEMKMNYIKWSPWNEIYQSDQLMEALKIHFSQAYPGNDFLEIDINEQTKAFAKVDGNRQIVMYPLGDKDVMAKITDLRHSDLLNK